MKWDPVFPIDGLGEADEEEESSFNLEVEVYSLFSPVVFLLVTGS